MLSGVVVVCSIFYSSIIPFSGQKQTTIVTKSVSECKNVAQDKYGGAANNSYYDLNTELGRKQFEVQCGINGKDCKIDF